MKCHATTTITIGFLRPTTGRVANVILANDKDEDDDAEAYLVEEAPKDDLSLDLAQATINEADVDALKAGGGEHGALVQEILETQKQLEEKPKKVEIVTIKNGLNFNRIFNLFFSLGKRRWFDGNWEEERQGIDSTRS